MSEPHIALVAEGSTDYVVIEAALKAIIGGPFVLTQLQPEKTNPQTGQGWGGVFKWCWEFRKRGSENLGHDPTLGGFDMVIIHLDADVLDKSYADYGESLVEAAADLHPLPCPQPCPPPERAIIVIEDVLKSWLGVHAVDEKAIFCIPSKTCDAWLAAAILPDRHELLNNLECNLRVETDLRILPLEHRVKKSRRFYMEKAKILVSSWPEVKRRCPQAAVFERNFLEKGI